MDWRDVSKGDGGMSIDEWFAFARDFNLGPGTNRVDSGPLSRAAVAASFREANHGRGSDDDEDALSFDEFRDALARCAARGFSDETNARANAVVSVSSPDVTFAGSSPRGSPAATLPRDAFGRVVDVPRGKNTRRNVSPNGVASSYASSHASSWSASSPSLVRAFARAPAPRRERSYAYKESLAPGSPTPTKYDVEYPTQYCPVGGLPAVYHSEMVDMVRRRERSDEVAEARRKVGLARERARRLEANRAKRAERERRQVAAGQMIAGFPSEFEENRREGAVVRTKRRRGESSAATRAGTRRGARGGARGRFRGRRRGSRRRDVANDAPGRARVLRARHENAKRAHRAPRRRRADVPDQQGVRQDGGGGRWRRVHVLIGRKIREVPGVRLPGNARRPVRGEETRLR